MLSKKMEEAINRQVNNEMYSAFLYMAMSADSAEKGLDGFARWFMVQYHEEMFHAMKFYNYLQDHGSRVVLGEIKQPPASFASIKEMFEKTYEHEKFITKCIHDLVELAIAEKDHASHAFLQWYVTEQVEEEKNDTEILAKLAMIGENPQGIFMLNGQLGARPCTVPTDFSAAGGH